MYDPDVDYILAMRTTLIQVDDFIGKVMWYASGKCRLVVKRTFPPNHRVSATGREFAEQELRERVVVYQLAKKAELRTMGFPLAQVCSMMDNDAGTIVYTVKLNTFLAMRTTVRTRLLQQEGVF